MQMEQMRSINAPRVLEDLGVAIEPDSDVRGAFRVVRRVGHRETELFWASARGDCVRFAFSWARGYLEGMEDAASIVLGDENHPSAQNGVRLVERSGELELLAGEGVES